MPTSDKKLPPGQRERADFPRFGLPQFVDKCPNADAELSLRVRGDVEDPRVVVSADLESLPRVEQVSDFHCVTSWSCCNLRWSGYRFTDFFEQLVSLMKPSADVRFVVLRCRDGFETSLPLEDLLRDNVLLADRLDGQPLGREHGAPLRIVAPDHYGFKNAKHLSAIEFRCEDRKVPSLIRRFVSHPRGRVAYEERGSGIPGWLLRYVWRPFIGSTVRDFQRGLQAED